ncbi:VOC family protein [uncultured Nocardioides sp.]|uniref:VOC family protein n=1 Tax=uncultured Nocardioides sp. TaxID=198441 RepID=UPI0026079CFA|nr:VOC family protein [uncultured Nocardioides sp.]
MPTETGSVAGPGSSPVSGPVAQVCWVVPDIAASESFLASVLGVGGWTSMSEVRFGPDETVHRGRPADFTVLVSLAWAGDLQVELIQPVAGESLYAEFLAEHPAGGLHHVAFETEDLAASVAAAGLPVLSEGSMGGGLMRFAYLDGSAHGVPFVELLWLSEEMREVFSAMRRG